MAAGGLVYYFTREQPQQAAGTSSPQQPATSPSVADKALLEKGKLSFGQNCAQCHGNEGAGDGLAARFLYPKPRNFRDAKFKIVSTTNRVPTDDDLFQMITNGMPGSTMIPFQHLPEAERRALVVYVRHLARQGVEQRLRQAAAQAGQEIDPQQLQEDLQRLTEPGPRLAIPALTPTGMADAISRGQALYKKDCATCHGDTGRGDGAKEQFDDDGTPTRPRDFSKGIFKGGGDRAQLFARISLGLPGTPMPALPHLKPNEIDDLIALVQTYAPAEVQQRTRHRRTTLMAKRVATLDASDPYATAWETVPAQQLLVTPIWWRDQPDPDLRVQAAHDGTTLFIRLSWHDAVANEVLARPEDFEDMASVQLFKGEREPFFGMGTKEQAIDLWLWRASWRKPPDTSTSILDDYPFELPIYKSLLKGQKPPPDFLTARAAGNLQANADRARQATHLAARGFGTTTVRPKSSQLVAAKGDWKDGRWTVLLSRPMAVDTKDGVGLKAGDGCSIALAIWDGQHRDRDGQKLVSIWHDLKLE
jgi:mono/diheme cytochrome c family protein